MRQISAALGLTVVASLVAAAPAHAAPAPHRPDPTVTEQQTFDHRLAPQLGTDAAGDQVLAMGVPDGHGDLRRIVVRERTAGDAWGPETTLARAPKGLTAPTLTVGADGTAALAWADGPGEQLQVRVRDRDGTWGPATTLRHLHPWGTPQVLVNAHGDVAVAAAAISGDRAVAVRHRGSWDLSRYPGYTTPDIALADDGTLYAVSDYVERGGEGTVTWARRTPTGSWSKDRLVRGVGAMPEDVQLLSSPDGVLTLVVGYASNHWASTQDTETYFSTAVLVLRADHWGGPLRKLWRRDGAVYADPSLSASGALQLTYLQWLDPVKHKPTHVSLRTTQVDEGGASRPVVLDTQPAHWLRGWYDEASGHTAGHTWTWWQAFPPDSHVSGDLRVTGSTVRRATGTAEVARTTTRSEASWTPLTAPCASGTEAAWTTGATFHHVTNLGWLADDGSVVVGSVSSG